MDFTADYCSCTSEMSVPWLSQIGLAQKLRCAVPELAADMSTFADVLQVLAVLSRVSFDSDSLEDDAGYTSAKCKALSGAIGIFCAFSLPRTRLCAAPQQQASAGLRERCLESVAPVILSMLLFSNNRGDANHLVSVVVLLQHVYNHVPARCKMLTAAATAEDYTWRLDAQGTAAAVESTAEEFKTVQSGAPYLQLVLAVVSLNRVQRCYTIPGLQLKRARQSTVGATDADGYASAVEAAGSADRRKGAATLQLCMQLMAAAAKDCGADTLIQRDSVISSLQLILKEVLQHGVCESLHALGCISSHAAGVRLHRQACDLVWLLIPVVSAVAGAWMQCEKEPLPLLPEMLMSAAETISDAAKFFTPDILRC